MQIKLTFDLLPVLAAFISVLAWVLPKFKDWYDKLDPGKKQLFMVGVIAGIDLVVVLLSIFGFVHVYSGPTWREWVWYPVVDFVIALMTNAGVYKGTNYIFSKSKG
jgi:hypothetical protein